MNEFTITFSQSETKLLFNHFGLDINSELDRKKMHMLILFSCLHSNFLLAAVQKNLNSFKADIIISSASVATLAMLHLLTEEEGENNEQ